MIGRVLSSMAAVALIAAMTGCGDNDDSDPVVIETPDNSQIAGNVVLFTPTLGMVSATPDVKVIATGPVTVEATTDAHGNFVFVGLQAGQYTLSFQYNGQTVPYLGADGQPVIINVGEDRRVVLTDILVNNGTITVRVMRIFQLDENGNVIGAEMPMTAPTLISPVTGANLDYSALTGPYAALLVWNPVTNVDHYVVQVEAKYQLISKVANGIAPVQPDWTPYVYTTTFETSYSLGWIDPNIYRKSQQEEPPTRTSDMTFRWRIWAVDSANNVSSPSEWNEFTSQIALSDR